MKLQAQHRLSRLRGRPRAENAGEIDALILDAATTLFLDRGFSRTTMDQVAAASGSGKATLYSRYENKPALFGAVVQRSIEIMFSELTRMPDGSDVTEQLHHTGRELLQNLLHPRCVALMRITASEAENFPGLAAMAYQVSLEGSVKSIKSTLSLSGITSSDLLAKRFVELVLQPAAFKALYGADPQTLLNRCDEDITDAIRLLFPEGLPSRQLTKPAD